MILPDVLAPGLHLVLCGTAPSRASHAARAYYAKPGNRFWPTLYEVGLIPVRLSPAEYPQVPRFGIGLTDLCKTEYGSDAELSRTAFDVPAFTAKMELYQPAAVAFDSKTAGQAFLRRRTHYGLQPETIGATRIFVVPSPSGRAGSYWDIGPWRELGDFVQARRAAAASEPSHVPGVVAVPPLRPATEES